MRVFLCSYNGFSLAIPISFVSSIALFNESTKKTIDYDEKNRNTYISLPRLFGLSQEEIKHAVILKKDESDEDHDLLTDKIILLTTAILCETEIAEDKVYSIPNSLHVMRFSNVFSGMTFASDSENLSSNIILLINLARLMQNSLQGKTND